MLSELSAIDILNKAINNLSYVNIVYKKRNNETIHRKINPKEIKKEKLTTNETKLYLYAEDMTDNKNIKKFNIDSFSRISLSE